MKNVFQPIVASLVLLTGVAAACEREPRYEMYQRGDVLDLNITTDDWTVVSLDDEEAILGVFGNREAIEISQPNRTNMPTTILVRARGDDVSEYLRLTTPSRTHYNFRLTTADCNDAGVNVEFDEGRRPSQDYQSLQQRDRKTLNSLMALYWMDNYSTPIPDGFREIVYNNRPLEERLLMAQGSLRIYLSRMWRGADRNVLLFEVVNEGRTALTFDITGLAVNDPEIRRSIGDVRMVSMIPVDRTLGPHPEFLSDLYSDVNPHEGILIVTVDRE